jgi:hypothetical protein
MPYNEGEDNQYMIACGGIMPQWGFNTLDANLRATTAGMFGATAAFVPNTFIWNPPMHPIRQANPKTCPITGYKGDASQFVSCDGLMVLRDFEVTGVNK